MNIISIANQKAGTGKTTTCANLAIALAHLKRKVLTIDLDSQANLTAQFGLTLADTDLTTYDLIVNSDIRLQQVKRNLKKNLDLVPSSLNLALLDIDLASKFNRDQRLKQKLKNISNQYDYVLIDCPPTLSFGTINAFTASNTLMICIQTHMFNLAAIKKLLEIVKQLTKQYDLSITAYALPTMYEKQSTNHKNMLKIISDSFGALTFSPINKNVRCIDASIAGVPVIEMDKDSGAAADYLRLAKETIREFEKKVPEKFNEIDDIN